MLRRTVLVGVALAVAVGLLVDHAGQFGQNMTNVALLGAALGAVAGLVPDGSPLTRIFGALAGMVVAQVGYGLRAGLLPDIPAGRAIAATVVVLVLTAIAVASRNRLRLWALLLGAGAFVGAYETVYDASPTSFVADSFAMATAVSLGAAVGFAVASFVSALTTPKPTEAGEATGAAFPVELPRQRSTSVDAAARTTSTSVDTAAPTTTSVRSEA
ncbi:MAG TPA: hypothetical protein VFT62_01970 [Mycobacteriales bacterium]|nr:hypothetical protein [Mycobacteriales bacterium]